jgi:hypothetical protein
MSRAAVSSARVKSEPVDGVLSPRVPRVIRKCRYDIRLAARFPRRIPSVPIKHGRRRRWRWLQSVRAAFLYLFICYLFICFVYLFRETLPPSGEKRARAGGNGHFSPAPPPRATALFHVTGIMVRTNRILVDLHRFQDLSKLRRPLATCSPCSKNAFPSEGPALLRRDDR